MQVKFLSRFLIVVCLVSLLSISVFAAGTSTTPAYPNSTYTYVSGLNSAGSVATSTASYFDAVTQSFKGLGNILVALNNHLKLIKSNTDRVPDIKTDTANLPTISAYSKSNNTLLSSINTGIADLETAFNNKAGAWTTNQATSVTSNVALIKSTADNLYTASTTSNTYLSGINNKVATESTLAKVATESTLRTIATEATLKTLAKESTASSILSIVSDIKPNIATITSKITDLADVLASPEDKELHENAKGNLDYVNGDVSSKVSDTRKFVSATSAIDSIRGYLSSGDDSSSFDQSFELIDNNSYSFWSKSTYQSIHQSGSSSVSASSFSPASVASSDYFSQQESVDVFDFSDLPYNPMYEYEKAMSEFGGDD